MKPVLFVIDMQKAWYGEASEKSMRSASRYINEAADLFRSKKLPVFWIYQEDSENGVTPGSAAYEMIDELKILPGEVRINKHYSNSFNKTECDRLLREMAVDTVVITGYCAEWCVLSTYRGAQDLDYTPILLRDANAGGSEENRKFVEKLSDIVTLGALGKMLELFPGT